MIEKLTVKALGLPLGKQNAEDGFRIGFVETVLHPFLGTVKIPGQQWVGAYQLQGNTLSGWAGRVFRWKKDAGGMLLWKPEPKIMRTCGRFGGELVSEPARKMIEEAALLTKEGLLDRVVFRVSPLVEELPVAEGIERYFSPVSAEGVIAWQDRQIETICIILGIAGEHAEKFEVEVLDWCQFKNRASVPTRFEGQLGSQEAAYISRRVHELTGVPLR